jgi:hypothetical protein
VGGEEETHEGRWKERKRVEFVRKHIIERQKRMKQGEKKKNSTKVAKSKLAANENV